MKTASDATVTLRVVAVVEVPAANKLEEAKSPAASANVSVFSVFFIFFPFLFSFLLIFSHPYIGNSVAKLKIYTNC